MKVYVEENTCVQVWTMKYRWYDVAGVSTGLWLSSLCSVLVLGLFLKRKLLGKYSGEEVAVWAWPGDGQAQVNIEMFHYSWLASPDVWNLTIVMCNFGVWQGRIMLLTTALDVILSTDSLLSLNLAHWCRFIPSKTNAVSQNELKRLFVGELIDNRQYQRYNSLFFFSIHLN